MNEAGVKPGRIRLRVAAPTSLPIWRGCWSQAAGELPWGDLPAAGPQSPAAQSIKRA